MTAALQALLAINPFSRVVPISTPAFDKANRERVAKMVDAIAARKSTKAPKALKFTKARKVSK